MLSSAVLFSVRQKIVPYWPIFLLFVFSAYLLSCVMRPPLADVMAGILLLVGLFGLRGSLRYLEQNPLARYEKYLLITLALYALVTVISFIYWPATRESHMRLEDDLKFLMFIPLYLVLRQYHFNVSALLVVFMVFAFLLGVVSILIYVQGCCASAYWPNIHPFFDMHVWNRPSGSVNPMRYGVIALITAGVLVNAKLIFKGKRWSLKMALLVGFVLALVACFLTQTRGVWLSVPVLCLAYMLYLFKSGQAKYMWTLLLVSVVLMVGLSQSNFIEKRINTTVHNLERYAQGDGQSSLGVRLDMYKFSFSLFTQNPIFGHGLGVYKAKAKAALDNGELEGVSVHVAKRRTPHNEFFLALIERGLIGLLAVLALFLVPGYIFYRALKSKDEAVVFYGLNGLVLLLVFFVAGQTGTLFNHNVFTHFYILLVLMFVSQINVVGRLQASPYKS